VGAYTGDTTDTGRDSGSKGGGDGGCDDDGVHSCNLGRCVSRTNACSILAVVPHRFRLGHVPEPAAAGDCWRCCGCGCC